MAEFNYQVLSTTEMRDLYPVEIRPRLEKTITRAPCGAHPEDFYPDLLDGAFSSITIECSGKIIGVAVVEEMVDRLTREKGLFVWATALDPVPGALDFFEDVLDEMAERYNWRYVRFSSSRREWRAMQRRKRPDTWREKAIVWEKQYGRQQHPETENQPE